MPKYGLHINNGLVEMLSLEAIQVPRGKKFNALQQILKDIQKEQNLFENNISSLSSVNSVFGLSFVNFSIIK